MKPTEASMNQKRKEVQEPGVNQNEREEGLRIISSRSAISGILHFVKLAPKCIKQELLRVPLR